ncbi:MAG TPA: TIGR02266 family protein [Polyangia bacterium]
MTVERRQGSRVPVQIWVEEKTDRELYFQRSANLSSGGIYLENTIPHPVGTRVNLRFQLPGDSEKLEVKAEVAAAIAGEDDFGMGLKFVDVPEAIAERIQKYVARTSG